MLNQKGVNNHNYKDGRTLKDHFCIDCGEKISKTNFLTGKQRCLKCKSKGRLNGRYIDGRTHNKKCIDCNKKIGKSATRCKSCENKRRYKNPRNNPRFGKPPLHGKRIRYKGILMRSTWEVKYAKYLDKNDIKWQYESKTFDLDNTTYTPDFYLPETDTYIEIKGRWRDDAKKKFKKFQKKYYSMNIILLTEKELKKLKILK